MDGPRKVAKKTEDMEFYGLFDLQEKEEGNRK